ncbi:MAG: hypothetical protein HF312_14515 [Ignavibacteria bacterium]|jgi:hypothetical protein|nr:hypothetical protein [Ignavibacteria bacterium]
MKRSYLTSLFIITLLVPALSVFGQRRQNPPIMNLDVGRINMTFNKLTGDGGLQSMYSWNLTGSNASKTEIFYYPADRWQSNMLYQIFNPLSLDNNGILNEKGVKQVSYVSGGALTNSGTTDWGLETRRYRPPHIVVDGLTVDAPYLWAVDPNLKSDIKIEFEDVLNQFGIRSHVEVYGFSNPDHADYFIWKATHKFTGELKIPRQTANSLDSIPDQTIRFWWPMSFSFGPTKAGERNALGGFSYEGEDDYDSWIKVPSKLGGARDSLYIAYYRDANNPNAQPFTNGSQDDTGDPDRTSGHLYSTQIPGFTLLHADKSYQDHSDDRTQPYSMAHASIETDLWGDHSNGVRLKYRGDDANGHFPVEPPTSGGKYNKGPMRFITAGPYELTKDKALGRVDSVTLVYAVGAGDIGWAKADSIGKLWLQGKITNQEKLDYMLKGRDSLVQTLDRANWAWGRLSKGQSVPATPPAPDMTVTSGDDKITVSWSYPDPAYFNDAVTKVDDWYAWRVYRKKGALLVDDPLDQRSGAQWELVYETKDRSQTTYVDKNVQRGVDYYYAVTAVDNGTQNPDDIIPNQKLESSRFATRSMIPAVPYRAGLDNADLVRVVPNPASRYGHKTGALNSGTPDRIKFFNLPYKCTLKVFTETGDLVKSFDHLGTDYESWDQKTDGNQFVATGIYILAITDAQSVTGKSSDNQFVKFIIVR